MTGLLDEALQIKKISVGEFFEIVKTWPEHHDYELRDGEITELPLRKSGHMWVQRLLREAMEAVLPKPQWAVETEFPFEIDEHNWRQADVVAVDRLLWKNTPKDENFRGSPSLVIEVLSPSNTKPAILRTCELCLTNGCLEFWVVDQGQARVTVYSRDTNTGNLQSHVYHAGDSITLAIEPLCTIPVAPIFE